MSNSQLSTLKLGIKNVTEVASKISSNVVGDFNDDNNCPHKLPLTNTKFWGIVNLMEITPQLI